jgi:hypothetical protein
MRWEDERYVRVYTRDTPAWIRIGWEARAVFHELLRKVDRRGVLEVHEDDVVADVAAVIDVPEDVVERALQKLTAGRSAPIEIIGNRLLVRNFIEAQEAVMSPALRQRLWRERRQSRDDLRGTCGEMPPNETSTPHNETSTEHNGTSTDVDAARRGETARDGARLRTELYRTEPSGSRARVLALVNGVGQDQAMEIVNAQRTQAARLAKRQQELQRELWPNSQQRLIGEPDLLPVMERLEEGYTPEQLEQALEAMADDARRDPKRRGFLWGATTWSKGVVDTALGRAASREAPSQLGPGSVRPGDEWLTWHDLAKREARLREQGKPIPWANDPARQRMTHDRQGNRLEPCGGDA